MRANSLAVRLFLSATSWTVITLFITGFVLSALYRQAVERSFDRRLGVYLRTLVADVAAPEEASARGDQQTPQSGAPEARGGSIGSKRSERHRRFPTCGLLPDKSLTRWHSSGKLNKEAGRFLGLYSPSPRLPVNFSEKFESAADPRAWPCQRSSSAASSRDVRLDTSSPGSGVAGAPRTPRGSQRVAVRSLRSVLTAPPWPDPRHSSDGGERHVPEEARGLLSPAQVRRWHREGRMWTSKTGRTSGRSTRGKGVVQGLAGLLGIGLCLGISSASAGDATQAVSPQATSPQAPAQGRAGPPQRAATITQRAPQRAATTTQRAPQQTAIITQRAPQRVPTAAYVANPRRTRWIIAGASTLGGFWVASAVRGAALSLAQPEVRIRLVPQCSQGACFLVRRHERTSANPASLLIPLAGPWIHLGTGRPTAANAVGLSLLGAGQAVGLGMLLGGIAMPSQVRVPLHRGQVLQVGAAPLVTPGGLGLSISGSL